MEAEDPRAEDRTRSRSSRKERVLHTRVSEALADDIRSIADDLRVPVSNLVRNVLEEVFDVVEAVSEDVGGVFEEILDEAEGARQRIARSRSRRSQRQRDRAAWDSARDEVRAAEQAPPPPRVAWHYVHEGRAAGPIGSAELADAIRSGRIDGDTRVWSAGMRDWKRAGEIEALAHLFAPPPVPEA